MDAIQRVELYHSWMDQTTVQNVTKGFCQISFIQEEILTEYKVNKNSFESKLHFDIICSFKKRSSKRVKTFFRSLYKMFGCTVAGKIFYLQIASRSSALISSNLQCKFYYLSNISNSGWNFIEHW